jgi:uncharacterized membrane protein YphA (DoxX/SURF4 family)
VIKLIGALELLAAIGLILPAVLDIAPVLVPLAATGLAVTMVGAAIVHIRRKEYPMLVGNAVFYACLKRRADELAGIGAARCRVSSVIGQRSLSPK